MTIINVQSFGAKGNGITDDTSAIRAAIDCADPPKAGVVYFPSGSYHCGFSGPLDLNPIAQAIQQAFNIKWRIL